MATTPDVFPDGVTRLWRRTGTTAALLHAETGTPIPNWAAVKKLGPGRPVLRVTRFGRSVDMGSVLGDEVVLERRVVPVKPRKAFARRLSSIAPEVMANTFTGTAVIVQRASPRRIRGDCACMSLETLQLLGPYQRIKLGSLLRDVWLSGLSDDGVCVVFELNDWVAWDRIFYYRVWRVHQEPFPQDSVKTFIPWSTVRQFVPAPHGGFYVLVETNDSLQVIGPWSPHDDFSRLPCVFQTRPLMWNHRQEEVVKLVRVGFRQYVCFRQFLRDESSWDATAFTVTEPGLNRLVWLRLVLM